MRIRSPPCYCIFITVIIIILIRSRRVDWTRDLFLKDIKNEDKEGKIEEIWIGSCL